MGRGGESLSRKLMEKREEKQGEKEERGWRQRKIDGGRKVGDEMRQGGRLRNGMRGREKRCYFKTILTDNVTLLQSAKRSCHAPA